MQINKQKKKKKRKKYKQTNTPQAGPSWATRKRVPNETTDTLTRELSTPSIAIQDPIYFVQDLFARYSGEVATPCEIRSCDWGLGRDWTGIQTRSRGVYSTGRCQHDRWPMGLETPLSLPTLFLILSLLIKTSSLTSL